MNHFLLYEQMEDNKARIIAEGVKFSNGKCCVSVLGSVDTIQVYDNIDKMSSVVCNDKVKLHIIVDNKKKEEEKKEE